MAAASHSVQSVGSSPGWQRPSASTGSRPARSPWIRCGAGAARSPRSSRSISASGTAGFSSTPVSAGSGSCGPVPGRRCAGCGRHSLGRIVVGERTRGAEERRDVFRVVRESHLERLHRFPTLILLEEELAPGGIDGRIAGCSRRGIPESGVRFLKATNRAKGSPAPSQIGCVVRSADDCGDPIQRCSCCFALAEHLLQKR